MSDVLNKSYRQERFTAPAETTIEVNFQDTRPNYAYFANNSAYNLYVSINPLVSDSLFDVIIPPYSLKMFARPELMHQLYVRNVSSLGDADFVCTSFQAPFDPKNLPQTQEIVGASAAGLLGIIEISEITSPLPAGSNVIGSVDLNGSLPSGTNVIGKVNLGTIDAGITKIGKIAIDCDSLTNGGTNHKKIAAASTNATSVKASSGRIHWLSLANLTASAKFLKLYDKASAPTVGTDTPIMTIPVQANQTIELAPPPGIYFATGIAYALTGAVADSDTTALSANDVVLNLVYA